MELSGSLDLEPGLEFFHKRKDSEGLGKVLEPGLAHDLEVLFEDSYPFGGNLSGACKAVDNSFPSEFLSENLLRASEGFDSQNSGFSFGEAFLIIFLEALELFRIMDNDGDKRILKKRLNQSKASFIQGKVCS